MKRTHLMRMKELSGERLIELDEISRDLGPREEYRDL